MNNELFKYYKNLIYNYIELSKAGCPFLKNQNKEAVTNIAPYKLFL